VPGGRPERARRAQVFWNVTLPNIRWGLMYGVILTNARAMGEFGAVSVISGNIIGRTQTLTLFVESAYKARPAASPRSCPYPNPTLNPRGAVPALAPPRAGVRHGGGLLGGGAAVHHGAEHAAGQGAPGAVAGRRVGRRQAAGGRRWPACCAPADALLALRRKRVCQGLLQMEQQ